MYLSLQASEDICPHRPKLGPDEQNCKPQSGLIFMFISGPRPSLPFSSSRKESQLVPLGFMMSRTGMGPFINSNNAAALSLQLVLPHTLWCGVAPYD